MGDPSTPGDGPEAAHDPAAVATEFVGGSMTWQGILPPSIEDPGGPATEVSVDANDPHVRVSNFFATAGTRSSRRVRLS